MSDRCTALHCCTVTVVTQLQDYGSGWALTTNRFKLPRRELHVTTAHSPVTQGNYGEAAFLDNGPYS